MRVMLKLILDCDPDAAWRALRSPAVFREVSSPLVEIESLTVDGFPTVWTEGVHPVEMRGAGIVPIGQQLINLSFRTAEHGSTRIVHDSGVGVRGAVATLKMWDHKMAVAPDPAGTGRTLYRDKLEVHAGLLTPAAWYGLWAFWQWRGHRLQHLAPTWAFDPPVGGTDADGDEGTNPDGAAGAGTAGGAEVAGDGRAGSDAESSGTAGGDAGAGAGTDRDAGAGAGTDRDAGAGAGAGADGDAAAGAGAGADRDAGAGAGAGAGGEVSS